jgi:hypothetical protein
VDVTDSESDTLADKVVERVSNILTPSEVAAVAVDPLFADSVNDTDSEVDALVLKFAVGTSVP